MEQPTNNELNIQLKNLCENTETGFRGVHDRLDKLNGQVATNTTFRHKAEGSLGTIKWLLGFIGIGNLALLVKVLFM